MNEFKKSGKTIVLVTHDLGTVQAWCDLAAWIDEGQIRSVGDPREVVAQYRQAVELGETRFATLLPANSSASETPASPQLPASAAPQLLAANGRAQFGLRLKRVRLLDQLGREARTLGANDGLDVVIEFETSGDLVDVGFSIRIFHSEGLQVYGTSSFIESVAFPSPLPRSGVLCFTIERLGLGGGTYSLDIAAQNRAAVDYDSSKGVCSFTVSSNTQETGIVRLPHRWSLVGRDYKASEVQPFTGS